MGSALNRIPLSQLPPEEVSHTFCKSELRHLISNYESKAEFEEHSGCFGLAEMFWKKAFDTSTKFFPGDKETAKIAKLFGLFLNRFLPTSEQSIRCLRIALSIEQCIDSSSSDTVECQLQLAKCLISADCCEEAELLLQALMTEKKGETVILRAYCLIGRIRYVRHDLLQSERILKETVAIVKHPFPDSDLLLEALTYLGQTLAGKKEAVLVNTERDDIIRRRNGTLNGKSRQVHEHQYFESLRAETRSQALSPYQLAAECCSKAEHDPQYRALWLLRALNLYRSVRPVSWYVARVLRRLYECFSHSDSRFEQCLADESEIQLSALLDDLPSTSTMLCDDYVLINVKRFNMKLAQKVLAFISSSEDELVIGEALLAFASRSRVTGFEEVFLLTEEYIESHPASRVTARICGRIRSHDYLRKFLELSRVQRASPFEIAQALADIAEETMRNQTHSQMTQFRVRPCSWESKKVGIQEVLQYRREALELCRSVAPISIPVATHLQKIAQLDYFSGYVPEAETAYCKALHIVSMIDSDSEETAQCLHDMGLFYAKLNRDSDAEACLRRAFDIVVIRKELAKTTVRLLVDFLSFYIYSEQRSKLQSVVVEYVAFFQSLPVFPVRKRTIIKLTEEMAENANSVSLLKQIISLFVEHSPEFSPSFHSELQQFWTHRGPRPTSTQSFCLTTRKSSSREGCLFALVRFYQRRNCCGGVEHAIILLTKECDSQQFSLRKEKSMQAIRECYAEK